MDSPLDEFIHSLYIKHSAVLLQRAYRLLGDRAKAEELMQETFLIAVAKAAELTKHPNPSGWLHTTLSNLIYRELRKKNISEHPLGDDIELFPDQTDEANFRDALPSQLPEDERNILIWRYEERLSYREIADQLGISLSACGMRLQRAKNRYRKLIEKEK